MTNKDIARRDQENQELAQQAEKQMIPPAMDVLENDNEYLLIADVPGVTAKDVQIELHNGELTIRAAVGRGFGVDLFSGGRTTCEYARRFHIPSGIELDKVGAELNSGVLKLRIPKSAERKPRQIPVNVA